MPFSEKLIRFPVCYNPFRYITQSLICSHKHNTVGEFHCHVVHLKLPNSRKDESTTYAILYIHTVLPLGDFFGRY